MAEFFHMGGYAFYVWVSYLLTLAVLVWNFVFPLMKERQLMQRIARGAARRGR